MQFILFLINGLVLGVFTLILQYIIDLKLQKFFLYHQLIASILTITPFILINFISQRKFIFKRNGSFVKFILSSIFIMLMVSITSEILSKYSFLNYYGFNLSFAFAALINAPLSFLIKKNIIFP